MYRGVLAWLAFLFRESSVAVNVMVCGNVLKLARFHSSEKMTWNQVVFNRLFTGVILKGGTRVSGTHMKAHLLVLGIDQYVS